MLETCITSAISFENEDGQPIDETTGSEPGSKSSMATTTRPITIIKSTTVVEVQDTQDDSATTTTPRNRYAKKPCNY